METVQRLEMISRQVRATDLPIASVSKRVFVQNLLRENVFDSKIRTEPEDKLIFI